ncbi:MAG: hypothetical protein HYV07_07175 [Deltaproteobacteria bacterium]|nr:hypothetical protein [Deltaproteobacteria bacterium]
MTACISDATQLVVVVDSDLSVPDDLSRVRASVRDAAGALIAEHTFTLSGPSAPPPGTFALPLSFGVVPKEGASEEVLVALEAIGPSDVLFTRAHRTSFVANEARRLLMFLSQRCVTESCVSGSTCTETGCSSERVDPATLPGVVPGTELEGLPDAGSLEGPDAGPTDSGSDDATTPIETPTARLSPSPPYELNLVATNPNRPEIRLGQTVSLSLTLASAGRGTLVVSGFDLTRDVRSSFRLVGLPPLPAEIPSGSDLGFQVEYHASAVGEDSGRLEITTNDTTQGAGTGRIVAELSGTTSACPDAEFAEPGATATPAGVCQYRCLADHYDIDLVPGCEYACSKLRESEDPDDLFADENCDGVDGTAASSIFVARPPIGDDGNDGSMQAPFATISAALSAATIAGTSVLVSKGVYLESLELVSGVSIFGGYDAEARWGRSALNQVRIEAAGIAVRARSLAAPVVLDRLFVRASTAATAGGHTVGLDLLGSTVEVHSSTIAAGSGAAGADGLPGEAGAEGGAGGPGEPGESGGSTQGAGGLGVESTCGPGTAGSSGGNGGYDNSPGTSGEPLGSLAGGAGGPGAEGCATCSGSCVSGRTRGAVGSDGAQGATAGQSGGDGIGAMTIGVWAGDEWVAESGAEGTPGTAGTGGSGGGGGGGGADECFANVFGECVRQNLCNSDKGGGGGAGGGGGCGGLGGKGGQGGGASFGALVIRSTLALDRVRISTDAGGRGGDGGPGGTAGPGGAGGAPGEGRDDSGAGGRGGAGAPGGTGGAGGGGAGGVSYCAYVGSTSILVEDRVEFFPGTGGSPGGGPSPGVPGESGTIWRE